MISGFPQHNFCVFCLSTCSLTSDFSMTKFWKVWQKFTECEMAEQTNTITNCCSDCVQYVEQFCDGFKEWEVLKLKLLWRLGNLVNIVNEVDINQIDEQSDKILELFADLRKTFKRNSHAKGAASLPNLILNRVPCVQEHITPTVKLEVSASNDEDEPFSEDNGNDDGMSIGDSEEAFPTGNETIEDVELNDVRESKTVRDDPVTTALNLISADKNLSSQSSPNVSTPAKQNGRYKFGDRRRTHQCTVSPCTEKFYTPELRSIHETYHGGPFQCYFCPENTDYAPDLSLHELTFHVLDSEEDIKYNEKICCPRCPFTCKQTSSFVRHHVQAHLNLEDISVKCSICQDAFTQPRRLRDHVKTLHNIEGLEASQIFRCDQCDAYFNQAYNLVLHKNRVHLKHRRCPVCSENFVTISALKSHLERFHPEEKPDFGNQYKCNVPNCGKLVGSLQNLEVHQKACAAKQNRPESSHYCDKCGKSYKSKKLLYLHNRNVHREAREICPECGKTFKTACALAVHLEYHKSREEWRYSCEECGKKFADCGTLKKHQLVHSKVKAFVCQYCGAKMGYAVSLRKHMKKQHPDKIQEVKVE